MKSRKLIALIADDDEFFRMALASILTSKLKFAEVVQAASLDEAVEKLSARSDISLALFDLAMPGIESPANLRAVRDCFKTLRVAVVSGSKSRRDVLTALEAGVHGYVPKGLGVTELAHALQLIVDGVIYVPPSIATLPSTAEERPAPPRDAVSPPKSALATLTPRQRGVLALLVEGKSNKAIARDLDLGEGTVKVHMAALFRSLGVSTRTAAAVAGGRLLQPEP
ncbi:response regulator transcription factor [Reyranella sp.]|uniref:LuxR C-terminal-related transcriptional regulator n=1 Tax=Reyranella sp. TaxID=1929291 RepID=UPI0027305869|nr:response regulator transcription factor [Reyranella sp.]MDP2378604.1 response regulator transcription factor [Reyranella sp.]